MPNDRCRRWQLTENNATIDKNETLRLLATVGKAQYIVACSEIGEKGTKHNHAFVVYDNAIRLSSLKAVFPRAHFEPCVGSNTDNRDYIIKDDEGFVESGKMPLDAVKRKSKQDIASDVVALLSAGKSLFEVVRISEYTDYVVRNYRQLKDIENDFRDKAFLEARRSRKGKH